ncbi:MAG TPA: lipopolysaccharide biosynthesis protein [Bryobacteraceae bacterium]|nr:lipopolysaccharide biosynthesis protein [Bryobacteraceae bacterium]
MTASVGTPLTASAGLSLRRNFMWTLVGNIFYALCQWAIIIVLAKLTTPLMVGQFSLGLAISTPVIMLANLQLKVVQATDVHRAYRFSEYLGLRTVTTTLAFFVIVAIAGVISHEPKTMLVVIAVAVAKSIESMSDVFYGLFQLHDHLDQTGTSMMIRGALSVTAMSTALYFTRDVLWGVSAMALAWFTSLLLFDARRGQRFLATEAQTPGWIERWKLLKPRYTFSRQWTLTRIAFPLGIVMTLASLNMNVPRYFVQSAMGETDLGVFSIMAYTMTAISTVVDAMRAAAVPKLARYYVNGKMDSFRSLLAKMGGMAAALGVLATLGILWLGSQVLLVLYGPDYASYAGVLVWLTAASGCSAVASLLMGGLDSSKRFRVQVPMFVAVVATNAIGCAILVPRFGLTGAAIASLIASAVHMAIAFVLVSRVCLTPGGRETMLPALSDSWGSGL